MCVQRGPHIVSVTSLQSPPSVVRAFREDTQRRGDRQWNYLRASLVAKTKTVCSLFARERKCIQRGSWNLELFCQVTGRVTLSAFISISDGRLSCESLFHLSLHALYTRLIACQTYLPILQSLLELLRYSPRAQKPQTGVRTFQNRDFSIVSGSSWGIAEPRGLPRDASSFGFYQC